MENNFPHEISEFWQGATRRQFLKVMAASFCMAGLTGCSQPKEKIVPYSQSPEETDPGKTKQFATAMELGGAATGLLATSYDGRPIKIDGNPDHPFSGGAASVIAQAAILELYDPDRGQKPSERIGGKKTDRSWSEAEAFIKGHFKELKRSGGKGFAILSEAINSITLNDMRERLSASFPQMKWREYEPVNRDNEREASRIALGIPVRIIPQLNQAKVILSLDADLFGFHPTAMKNAADFAKERTPQKEGMNRLYAVESRYTQTGAMADHRLPLPSSKIESFALALLAELVFNQNVSLGMFFQILAPVIKPYLDYPFDKKWLSALAKDLAAHSGACFVAAGDGQTPILHLTATIINDILRGFNKTFYYCLDPNPNRPSFLESIAELAKEITSGTMETLVILGGNPVYDAPADLAFASLLPKIKTSIHLSLYPNETSALCNWNIPRAHFLESWGDARAYDGVISFIQPLIEPLYGGKSVLELLEWMNGGELNREYDILLRSFQKMFGKENFERSMPYWLHCGFIENTNYERVGQVYTNVDILRRLEARPYAIPQSDKYNLELVFYPDFRIYDGRFANNGWLQETPDFLTQLTWDNAALIAPSTAKALGIEHGELIRIQRNNQTVEIAAYLAPGQAPNSIALALGYGRTAAGRVGDGVGFAVNPLRDSRNFWFGAGAKIEKTGRKYTFALAQDRFGVDALDAQEREARIHQLIPEAALAAYLASPDYFKDFAHPPDRSAEKERESGSYRWGMAIDMNVCIGCNACVAACQAENNIPVVGKDQAAKGREMSWIRIDRYFSGEIDNPRVVHQPIACVHCENAPCEPVCPVGATGRSSEGVNMMVYNRCVGKQNCAKNCPLKVRRFNYLNYHKNLQLVEEMMYNPEVTVRSRGVMEKCTYCIQRIEAARIHAKNHQREISDGEIVPACAQTCPTQAIVFGDLSNSSSRVSQLQKDQRAYTLFSEIKIKPRTAYLARIRNENQELMG